MKNFFLSFLLLSISFNCFAQTSFFIPADSLKKGRVVTVAGSWVGIYGTTMIGLNALWYKNYPRSSFHFFNDNGEWNQVDKVGHCYTAYIESQWSATAFQWTGMKRKKAYILGGLTGFTLQTTIEILDGFSSKWGFSVGDISANTLGSAINVTQNLLWDEQRIRLKFSSHPVKYSPDVTARAKDLYGTSIPELVMKDYNGQTYWLSVNPSSFIKHENKFPKWLNISFGYGADGMLGGFENKWTDESGNKINRTDIQRTRQFYLTPDISFSRIKTNSHFLKTIFELADVIKFPAPALEYNTSGNVKWHWIYF